MNYTKAINAATEIKKLISASHYEPQIRMHLAEIEDQVDEAAIELEQLQNRLEQLQALKDALKAILEDND